MSDSEEKEEKEEKVPLETSSSPRAVSGRGAPVGLPDPQFRSRTTVSRRVGLSELNRRLAKYKDVSFKPLSSDIDVEGVEPPATGERRIFGTLHDNRTIVLVSGTPATALANDITRDAVSSITDRLAQQEMYIEYLYRLLCRVGATRTHSEDRGDAYMEFLEALTRPEEPERAEDHIVREADRTRAVVLLAHMFTAKSKIPEVVAAGLVRKHRTMVDNTWEAVTGTYELDAYVREIFVERLVTMVMTRRLGDLSRFFGSKRVQTAIAAAVQRSWAEDSVLFATKLPKDVLVKLVRVAMSSAIEALLRDQAVVQHIRAVPVTVEDLERKYGQDQVIAEYWDLDKQGSSSDRRQRPGDLVSSDIQPRIVDVDLLRRLLQRVPDPKGKTDSLVDTVMFLVDGLNAAIHKHGSPKGVEVVVVDPDEDIDFYELDLGVWVRMSDELGPGANIVPGPRRGTLPVNTFTGWDLGAPVRASELGAHARSLSLASMETNLYASQSPASSTVDSRGTGLGESVSVSVGRGVGRKVSWWANTRINGGTGPERVGVGPDQLEREIAARGELPGIVGRESRPGMRPVEVSDKDLRSHRWYDELDAPGVRVVSAAERNDYKRVNQRMKALGLPTSTDIDKYFDVLNDPVAVAMDRICLLKTNRRGTRVVNPMDALDRVEALSRRFKRGRRGGLDEVPQDRAQAAFRLGFGSRGGWPNGERGEEERSRCRLRLDDMTLILGDLVRGLAQTALI